MNEVRIILVCRKTILSGTASILVQSGIPISLSYILTTTKKHAETGQPVYAPAPRVMSVFGFVTLKEATVGISVGPNPSARADGTLLYWIGVNLDIEDRKQAEFYLAEGQRLARSGSWAFNAAGFDYWSPELFRIYGLDPSGKAPTVEEYMELVHPDDRKFVAETIQKMFAEGRGFDFTKRIVRPDGEIRRVRCVGSPATHVGPVQEFVGTGMDVTDHELLTQELGRSEAYLAEAQRLSHTGSFGWKPDTDEIIWSDEAYRIFEYDQAVMPTIDLLVQRVHPEDRADFQSVIERASRGAPDFEHFYRLLLPAEFLALQAQLPSWALHALLWSQKLKLSRSTRTASRSQILPNRTSILTVCDRPKFRQLSETSAFSALALLYFQ